jgi:hypothetical protein
MLSARAAIRANNIHWATTRRRGPSLSRQTFLAINRRTRCGHGKVRIATTNSSTTSKTKTAVHTTDGMAASHRTVDDETMIGEWDRGLVGGGWFTAVDCCRVICIQVHSTFVFPPSRWILPWCDQVRVVSRGQRPVKGWRVGRQLICTAQKCGRTTRGSNAFRASSCASRLFVESALNGLLSFRRVVWMDLRAVANVLDSILLISFDEQIILFVNEPMGSDNPRKN